jgi:hypothetical protein
MASKLWRGRSALAVLRRRVRLAIGPVWGPSSHLPATTVASAFVSTGYEGSLTLLW